jgi:hypothetical protein
VHSHAQNVLQRTDILVESSKEGLNFSGNVNRPSHPFGRLFWCSNRVADGIPPEDRAASHQETEKLQST